MESFLKDFMVKVIISKKKIVSLRFIRIDL